MAKPQFSQVWQTVVALAGQQFRTRTGLSFTYKVDGGAVLPSRAKQRIGRSNFEVAFKLVPISGPGEINDLVRGPAYVWAILHDARVSGGAW
jgi:hypothetical protein